jgi:hypothetical protein
VLCVCDFRYLVGLCIFLILCFLVWDSLGRKE